MYECNLVRLPLKSLAGLLGTLFEAFPFFLQAPGRKYLSNILKEVTKP